MCSDSPSKQFEALARKIRRGSTTPSRQALRGAAGIVRLQEQRMAQSVMQYRTRSVEAFLACVMVGFGGIFAAPGQTLSLRGWDYVRQWVEVFPGNEYRFGLLLMFVGTVRICALIINGKWYPTPAARLIGCIVGSVFYTSCAVSFYLGTWDGPLPTAIAWDLVAVIFEWFSAARAASDMHVMDSLGLRARAARNASRL
jgi:hypothetical protein